jgi:P27 family predicted phage terminase small subunit
MNKRGPNPKPTKLKELEGNPGKRPLNMKEPQPAMLIPSCPAFLKGAARREWKRITPELYTIGLLTSIDRAALAGYCQAYGRWEEAERQLNELGKISKGTMKYLYKTTNGNLIISPLLSVSNKAMEQMHKFLTEFGMTPASRSRIIVDKSNQIDDALSEFVEDYGSRKN